MIGCFTCPPPPPLPFVVQFIASSFFVFFSIPPGEVMYDESVCLLVITLSVPLKDIKMLKVLWQMKAVDVSLVTSFDG